MWWGARPQLIAIGGEVIRNLALILALAVLYLILRLVAVAGVPADDLAFLERVDVWAIKGVSLAFSVAFVLHSILGSYASLRREKDKSQ